MQTTPPQCNAHGSTWFHHLLRSLARVYPQEFRTNQNCNAPSSMGGAETAQYRMTREPVRQLCEVASSSMHLLQKDHIITKCKPSNEVYLVNMSLSLITSTRKSTKEGSTIPCNQSQLA